MWRGFTFIEIIVLVVALGLLTAGGYIYMSQKLKPTDSKSDTKQTSNITQSTPAPTAQTTVTNKYADGKLPLGDGKITTAGPQKGYVYSCASSFRGGGAQHDGNWIEGSVWEPAKKLHVQGDVSWPTATVSISIRGNNRVITSNGLPTTHTTGIFPIQTSDPAFQIDRNPNQISAQSISVLLPLSPTLASSSTCLGGGPIGYMTNGVALFDALDASGRDAAAHEFQDHCDGHPQQQGEYHYHSLSSCFKDTASTTVIGFALDGFPITGNLESSGRILTTDDLDQCHGTNSTVNLDGKQVSMYHYVMTPDYPYSLGCFKGTPIQGSTRP